MNAQQHWEVESTGSGYYLKTRIVNQDGKGIAITLNPLDARLIASAPDLLEALLDMINDPLGTGLTRNKAIKAIAKATGK